jgi:hypothetical protein
MPSAAARTLADLDRALAPLGLRWYVFGAQAAIHYGSARTTADVDITVELAGLSPTTLVSRLAEVGIDPRIAIDEEFVAQSRVLPMVHHATGMGVDVVLAGPGPEQTFLSRAQLRAFENVRVPIAAPNDMVVMKVLAGRPKDVDDVVGILRAAPDGLDVGAVRAMLEELEELLGQSDLIPVLEGALARRR